MKDVDNIAYVRLQIYIEYSHLSGWPGIIEFLIFFFSKGRMCLHMALTHV